MAEAPKTGEPREITEDASLVEADSIRLSNAAARQVTAHDAQLENSAAVVVEAKAVRIVNSACVQVLGESITLVSTPVLMVGAERASIHDSPIFLFLGRAEGDQVQATLDWRGAVGLGAAFGIGLAVGGAVLNRLWRGR